MVWKCVYCWKAHKGAVTTISYYEQYNMLMSTSNSGQIRLVYLCDPGKVPPMEMVKTQSIFPDFIKDKLCKIFNEIQEIENNNYSNTEYQNLNLLNEYQAGNDEVIINNNDDNINDDNKEEEEPPEINEEELKIHNKVTDDIWNDNDQNNKEDEEKDKTDIDTTNKIKQDNHALLDEVSQYENTSLDDLL